MSSDIKERTDQVDIQKLVSSIRREIDSYWFHYDSANSAANLFFVHKVPQHILGVDRTAYEPTILSIGPYHHGKEPLQSMEKEKWNCLNFILRSNCSRKLKDYLNVIARSEKRARSCYSEDTKMERKTFLQMLLLDGCFILVFLNGIVGNGEGNRGTDEGCSTSHEMPSGATSDSADLGLHTADNSSYESIDREDCEPNSSNNLELCEISNCRDSEEKMHRQSDQEIHGSSGMGGWYSCCLAHDLLLFENQIPFYIVESIYGLYEIEMETRFLRERIAECMESILRHYPIAIKPSDRPKQFHHVLHLCHMYFRPTQKFEEKHQSGINQRFFSSLLHIGNQYANIGQNLEDNQQICRQSQQFSSLESESITNSWRRWRRAVQYHEAGVTLNKREYDIHNKHSLLDLKFSNGVIEIPCLPIDENTEALFKNLIALEQTNPGFGNDFTAYISFMSQLVTTPDDAALLVKQGIIVHMMDSDELSSLFTRLVKQVVINAEANYYLNSLGQTLERHYQSRLNRWMAWLWLNHFSNPWLALAVAATVVVLICTVVQTIYTVLAYVKPPSVDQ